ncbi:MAG: phosphotransferase [Oscillospiraceae bacterium]|nr:phosphotransferase [Oscillospiraceae bacterium]
MEYTHKVPIDKGWSGDRKFCVTDSCGTKYLLRISPPERTEFRRKGFELLKKVDELDVPICRPVEFGECEEGAYTLLTWIDGEDAEEVIPTLSPGEQYAYGLEAGRILKKIHSIPAPADQSLWEPRFNAKMDRKIAMHRDCPIQYDGGEAFVDYIEAHRHLLKDRPQTYQHGDFHIGNMMIADGKLVVIDFDRFDFGDPWEEFNRICWCAQKAPYFASGRVDGYFDGEVPLEFWQLLAMYISSNTLSSVPWAIPFGEEQIGVMLRQAKEVLDWYDGMKKDIPSWYKKPCEK